MWEIKLDVEDGPYDEGLFERKTLRFHDVPIANNHYIRRARSPLWTVGGIRLFNNKMWKITGARLYLAGVEQTRYKFLVPHHVTAGDQFSINDIKIDAQLGKVVLC